VQFVQPVLRDAEAPAAARFAQAAFHRSAAPLQQVPANGQEGGGEDQEQQERGEEPGRVERSPVKGRRQRQCPARRRHPLSVPWV
jgi:hypothetical protein